MSMVDSILSLERKMLSFYDHWRHLGWGYAVEAWSTPTHDEFARLFKHLKRFSPQPLVLDVGANEGNFAQAVLQWRSQAILHCIEPIPENIAHIKSSFASNQNVTIHELALSNQNGSAKLFKTTSTAGSSFQRPTNAMKEAFPEFAHDEAIEVKTMLLSDFFKENKIESCDLLKLDVQGHELPILETLDKCRDKIKAILVEVSFEHLYEDDVFIQTAIGELKKQGFYLKDFTHFVKHPKQGYLLQGDALFFNHQFQR